MLAGDIDLGVRGLKWARRQFPDVPVIYVAGNHEFYHGRLQDVRDSLLEQGKRSGVHVLDQDEITIGNVRFLGTTLWTDFALYGSSPEAVQQAMEDADVAMSDFRIVLYGDAGTFQARHSRELHLEQTRWLAQQLASPASGPTVVVTHHLPHRHSIHDRYDRDLLNPAFASDLDRLVRPPVALWIHGHTHESMDYVVNGTRVVCNPRGYLPDAPNPGFDPTLVVDLPAA